MDDTCKKELRDVLFGAIGKIELSDITVIFLTWDDVKVRLLNSLLKEKAVTKEEVLKKLHLRILEIGADCFEEHKRGRWPDHISSPYAFAYALHHGYFTGKEENSIEFDHGDTRAIFVEKYHKEDLPETVFNKLCTERDFSLLASCHADHCCCH